MRFSQWFRTLLPTAVAALCLVCSSGLAQTKSPECPNDDSGLKLPAGFCATVFADGIGHARHLVVAPAGVVYVNTWSGDYYDRQAAHEGGFLVALQDKTGAGKADVIERFGETVQSGGAGGTGIGIYKGSIYAEINDRIVRYSLPAGVLVPQDPPETVVSGLASGRRSSDASIHHRVHDGSHVRRRCQRHQFLPAEKPPAQNTRREPVHRTGDSRRHLALRRQQNEPDIFTRRPLRHRDTQWRRLCHRLRRPHVSSPSTGEINCMRIGPSSTRPFEEATLPAEEVMLLKSGRRLRLARMLLRCRAAKTGARPGIRRRRRQDGGRLREQDWSRCCFPRALGAERDGALRQETISGPLS